MADSSTGIASVRRAVRILELLKDMDGAGVSELQDRLDVSVSTTHAYLKSLEQGGLVVQRGQTYYLGFGCLNFGGYIRDSQEFYRYARPHLVELAQETQEIAAVSTLEQGKNVYLGYEPGNKSVNIGIHLGARVPPHCVASGKAILAHLPRERVRRLVDTSDLVGITDNTITDADELFEELDRVRERGFAYDNEERITGMRAVAAAVANEQEGTVEGAIVVSGPKNRLQGPVYREELPELVTGVAQEISVNLTYS